MSNKNAIPNLTSQDVEAALHAHALNLEAQFPETDEDIAAFFKTLDETKVPTPNVSKFMKTLAAAEGGKPAQKKGILETLREKMLAHKEVPDLAGYGAVAARKGKKKKSTQTKNKGGSKSSDGKGQ